MKAPWLVFLFALAACDACAHEAPREAAHDATEATEVSASPDAAPSAAPSAATSATGSASPAPHLDYLERTTGNARADEPLPMIVAIHGLGDRPENWLDRWDDFAVPARIILPRAPMPWHGGGSWFPYPPRSVDSLAKTVGASADGVADLLALLVRERPTRGKPIVTGFSQGGFLAFALEARHPGEIAAALPMSGSLPPQLLPSAPIADAPPLYAVHGADDDVVPIAPTRDAIARLRALGVHAELTEYPGTGHTITLAMRRNVEARLVALATAQARSGGPN